MILYRCCSGRPCAAHAGAGSGTDTDAQAARPRSKFFTVDLHCHALSLAVEGLVAERPEKLAEAQRSVQTLGEESARHNATQMAPRIRAQLTDPARRLADMDAMGVDVQVVSPAPNQYYYWADEALASRIVETQNQEIAELVRQHPGRIEGLGNIALQHPDLAVRQLRHAVTQLGLKGVEISSTVNGRELTDASLEPFWAAAAQSGCIVFLHPLGTSAFDRLNRFYLTNVIGQPLETAIALSHLIFSGLLDRHPTLKIVAAHGGGYLPAYFSRAEHAYKVRPEAARMAHAPREYLRRMWYDTVVYEPAMLRHLIDIVGASQLVVGTDYPYDMGEDHPAGLVQGVPGITLEQEEQILGGNATRLLGLSS